LFGLRSMCICQKMEAHIETGNLKSRKFLVEISTRLTDIAARSRAALACAESGSGSEALRIAMNIDEVIYEVKVLHGAMRLMGRK
jgi:hypothetical protein